jgi:type I restriction enzyme S subunit
MPLPPLETQRVFGRRVASVEKLKTAHRASLAEMDALFASLQHRAFRGEL